MISARKMNIGIMILGPLYGVVCSFMDASFFDSERYLLIRTFIGGLLFSLFLSFLLDTDKTGTARIDLEHSVFDFTKSYNSFFILGVTLAVAGFVCFLISALQSKQFLIPGFLFFIGASFLSGSLLYVKISKIRK